MSKITQSAISQNPANQNKKKLFWRIYLYTFLQILGSKFKIPISTDTG